MGNLTIEDNINHNHETSSQHGEEVFLKYQAVIKSTLKIFEIVLLGDNRKYSAVTTKINVAKIS